MMSTCGNGIEPVDGPVTCGMRTWMIIAIAATAVFACVCCCIVTKACCNKTKDGGKRREPEPSQEPQPSQPSGTVPVVMAQPITYTAPPPYANHNHNLVASAPPASAVTGC